MIKRSFFKGNMNKVTGSATVALLALGVLVSSQALAGIASTKHNLTPSSDFTNKFTPGGSTAPEICVFCHTPHGADSSAAVPLWNKDISVVPTYDTYSSLATSTIDGGEAPIGSISIACLSCHDGAQAMNTIINAPGSGLTNNAWNYGVAGATGDWQGTFDGKMATGIAMLNDADGLKNDHPISIQYGGGPATGTTAVLSGFKDPDFNTLQTATLNNTKVWWVDTAQGTAASRQKTDIFLYTRTETVGGSVIQPYVECGSCHDPHVDNVTVAGSNPTFLRISNNNSAVCLACHNK